MHLLQSMAELSALLSPAENVAYLSESWDDSAQMDMVSAEVEMGFNQPNHGHLVIKGRL